MKDLFEKGLDFARDVTSLLEKADGERRNCPRCRGSGLLNPRRLWDWSRKSGANNPCWFCEGVGVMPLFGLSGFMLGRASAAISTEKLRETVVPPVQSHLYLGKYPCTRPKFGSYNPTQDFASLLHKPNHVPIWTTEAAEEFALQKLDESEGGAVGKLSTPVLSQESKTLEITSGHSAKSAPLKLSSANARRVESRIKRLNLKGSDALLQEDSSSTLDTKAQNTARKHQDLAVGSYGNRITGKPYESSNTTMILSFRERIFEKSRKSEPKQVHRPDKMFLSMPSGAQAIPCLLTNSGTKRVRGARRRRNHIREKMEKETVENSWRFQRMLYTKPEQATPQESSQEPSDALQAFNGNWKDLSQKCLAELTASSRPSNKSRLPQVGSTAAYPPLVSQPFYGKLVGKVKLLPSVSKALKL
ncbi:hypothetical protein MPTK1_6g05700 [Marchantia polymorpha subsp. ruderalis]|uniref:Uncharacterized protein n=2 Tax=Marchantia polymorpha TaxID=3197 RepID=A0AAF6BNX8_MARPO|nr:hypothetical protein MARPO_0097s0072 [Marchantia polymorpha]PTQ32599.1 hypothetical protein MARPO_0097s0072 [Marchantia polymorpha]BBN13711.1 hypothetical protein Mp_6g05700 [Marchantia polymorpha subsp. ruderalis]BBN13712.1 hypothetical protein Mp_6g05700 [Marchantia polymorpha subsp. ruderalis]|eukprot:PTQ32598.1 hypothetical protein MARPO_0097s0072 [Marchantia polymorpha]